MNIPTTVSYHKSEEMEVNDINKVYRATATLHKKSENPIIKQKKYSMHWCRN